MNRWIENGRFCASPLFSLTFDGHSIESAKPNQTEPIQAIAYSVCVFVMADDVTANVIFLSSSFSFLSLIAVDITAGCYLVGGAVWLVG